MHGPSMRFNMDNKAQNGSFLEKGRRKRPGSAPTSGRNHWDSSEVGAALGFGCAPENKCRTASGGIQSSKPPTRVMPRKQDDNLRYYTTQDRNLDQYARRPSAGYSSEKKPERTKEILESHRYFLDVNGLADKMPCKQTKPEDWRPCYHDKAQCERARYDGNVRGSNNIGCKQKPAEWRAHTERINLETTRYHWNHGPGLH